MALRIYTVYLAGGATLDIKAARFEITSRGVEFFGDQDKPLEDTYIDPAAVIAVVPPSTTSNKNVFPAPRMV